MFLEISLFYAFYIGDIEGDVSCELSGLSVARKS